jgi:hypothetical protein
MFQTEAAEEIKTHIIGSNFFLYPAVYEIMWKKYCRAMKATDDNMSHAHCMLDT